MKMSRPIQPVGRARMPFLLFLIATALLLLVPAFSPVLAAKETRVVVLTDAAGLGDKGFNDVCWQGALRARRDFGISAQFVQAREQADYAANLAMAAQHAEAVVTLGYLYIDAVKQVAPQYPGVYFIHIEGDIPGENVACFDFKSEEGGFLAGLTAGLFSKSGKVGAVSGMEIPPVEAYVSGYRAGVKTAGRLRGQPIENIVTSAGSFNDPVKGKSLAQALMDKGVDVIFRVAGNTGIGVIEAVKGVQGAYAVAEDLDQDGDLPGKILVSALKRMDVGVYTGIQSVIEGKFQSGHRLLGTAEGAIDISEMKYTRQFFNPLDLERIAKARDLLRQKKFVVPKTQSEVESFQPPEL